MSTIALVPVKNESLRLPGKNYLDFDGRPLWEHKIKQLQEAAFFDQIYVGSDSADILDLAVSHGCEAVYRSGLEVDEVGGSANLMIREFSRKVLEARIMAPANYIDPICFWVHVTNPLVGAGVYQAALDKFIEVKRKGHDSLISVTSERNHAWFLDGDNYKPLNFSPKAAKHQLASDLSPVKFQNGAFFVQTLSNFSENSYFYGDRPYLFEVSAEEAIDINYPEDYAIAKSWLELSKS